MGKYYENDENTQKDRAAKCEGFTGAKDEMKPESGSSDSVKQIRNGIRHL